MINNKNGNTFIYKNARFVVAKFNEWWMEFVRDTVVSTCITTSDPCCSILPVFPVHWTLLNSADFNCIVVYLLAVKLISFSLLFIFNIDIGLFSLVRRTSVSFFFFYRKRVFHLDKNQCCYSKSTISCMDNLYLFI